MASHPELDPDPLIGSDRESGCEKDRPVRPGQLSSAQPVQVSSARFDYM